MARLCEQAYETSFPRPLALLRSKLLTMIISSASARLTRPVGVGLRNAAPALRQQQRAASHGQSTTTGYLDDEAGKHRG